MIEASPWIITVLVAVASPLIALLVARNQAASTLRAAEAKSSEAITISTATILDARDERIYAHMEKLRDALQADLTRCLEHAKACDERHAAQLLAVQGEEKVMQLAIDRMRAEIVTHTRSTELLTAENVRLTAEVARLVVIVERGQTQQLVTAAVAATVAAVTVPEQATVAAQPFTENVVAIVAAKAVTP